MNKEKLLTLIQSPYITEKSTAAAERNQVVFKVSLTANKLEIKKAVEQLFEVKVEDVRTVKVKGKTKAFGKRTGKRKDWKKAYVKLAEGSSIDLQGEA